MKRLPKGFTLIELLIGLTLLGFILSLLFAGFRLAARSWDSMEQKADQASQGQSVRQFLQQVLTQTRIRYLDTGVNRRIAFFGTHEKMRFISSLPSQFEGGGLRMMGLDVAKSERGETLSFRQTFLGPTIKDFSFLDEGNGTERLLIGDAKKIEFEYFGPEKPGAPPGWHDRWESRDAMPQLVRLRVEPASGAPWPALVVRIFLTDVVILCPDNVFPVPLDCVP